jgi:hypothetical protein
MPSSSAAVVVPEELRKKYPELLALILGSESMNDEERQYWINILPVMTTEQVENLRQILQNEKDQLAAIDAKYAQEMATIGQGKSLDAMGKSRRTKTEERLKKEKGNRNEERAKEEEILKAIEDLET